VAYLDDLHEACWPSSGSGCPDSTEIRVWDANSETRYLVLPLRSEGADETDKNELASLVTRNGLIGTASR
jgi:nitrile hydratase subunit alpha